MTFMEGREIRACGTCEEEHQPKRTIMAKRTQPKADRDPGWGFAVRLSETAKPPDRKPAALPFPHTM